MNLTNLTTGSQVIGFKIQKACALTEEELGHLTVRGTGLNIVAKLQEHGAKAEEPCADIVMAVEQGKVLGSMWMVRNLNVLLNLTDLTEFSFSRI